MSGMIVAGWDSVAGGQVYSVAIGGTMVPEKWQIDGSGSSYIWGICDDLYKDAMTREEAQDMALTALSAAMTRDTGSGGMIRLVSVNANGAERRLIEAKDLPIYPGELPMPNADIAMADR